MWHPCRVELGPASCIDVVGRLQSVGMSKSRDERVMRDLNLSGGTYVYRFSER